MSKDQYGYERPILPDRHTLLLQGKHGSYGPYTGPIWPLVEIRGLQSFSIQSTENKAILEITRDEASVWQREWKMTADWHLRWSRPELEVPVSKHGRARKPVKTRDEQIEDIFGYKFPVEPTHHTILLQGSRDGTYTADLWPLGVVEGIEGFAVRETSRATIVEITAAYCSVRPRRWEMMPNWPDQFTIPKEPKSANARRAVKSIGAPIVR